ncbi:MAG TPA: hypothetical protein VFY23_06295 [Candidatus Limnocylindrales bacterium]|jgi:hypothetical protein|nr:hypothetical protein [Candidatus Limnocylindrales bacterium]
MDDVLVSPTLEHRFPCARCGGEAARVSLAPRGGFDRTEARTELIPGVPRLIIDAPVFGIRHWLLGDLEDAPLPAAAALADGDAAALHAIDPELAPMWCPACEAVYCASEWTTWQVFAEDDPAWFEELRGRCPDGHERMLLD